jgi:hypothetical protein
MIDIIREINEGKVDVNNQQNFFSILIKGLMLKLSEEISVRNLPIPHIITHTGDDTMYIEVKNKDYSASSLETTNENYIYSIIPRCIVTPGGIDFVTDQLTSPHSLGQLQLEYDNHIYNLAGEFRRIPIKMGFELVYHLDTFSDMLELVQQIASKLTFIKTYNVVYMGQVIKCSYKIPESYQGEWMTEMDGMTQDSKDKKVSLSIEVESNYPIFNCRTIMDSSHYITGFEAGLHMHRKQGIEEDIQTRETIKWNNKI